MEVIQYVAVPLAATLHGHFDFEAWILGSGLDLGVGLGAARAAFWKVAAEEATRSPAPTIASLVERLFETAIGKGQFLNFFSILGFSCS